MKKNINSIVKKLKKGYSEYFDELYDATKNGVFFMIKSIVKDYSLSEDIMQDTYISFINKLDDIDENGNIYAYLLQTAKNKALNEVKKDARLVGVDYLENMECDEPDTFTPLLDFAKTHLENSEWRILKLTVVDGYRRVEVAKILNKPVATVNWQYNKILKKVEIMYKEVYDE